MVVFLFFFFLVLVLVFVFCFVLFVPVVSRFDLSTRAKNLLQFTVYLISFVTLFKHYPSSIQSHTFPLRLLVLWPDVKFFSHVRCCLKLKKIANIF